MMESLYKRIKTASTVTNAGSSDYFDLSAERMESQRKRDSFVRKFGWCIPNEAMIKQLAAYIGDRKVLSIASGLALVEHLLCNEGIDVTATDTNDFGWTKTPYMHVHNISAQKAVTKYDADVLLIVWPSYLETYACDAVKAFKGDCVIYIGEDRGGCTADESFFDELREWSEADVDVPMESWRCIHDSVHIYTRK